MKIINMYLKKIKALLIQKTQFISCLLGKKNKRENKKIRIISKINFFLCVKAKEKKINLINSLVAY